jgi:transcriptional regulator NrdR family protein
MTPDEGCKLPCPLCGSRNSRTMQTRFYEVTCATWRRRICLDCDGRFSTLEMHVRGEPAIRLNKGRMHSSSKLSMPTGSTSIA